MIWIIAAVLLAASVWRPLPRRPVRCVQLDVTHLYRAGIVGPRAARPASSAALH